VSLTLYVVSALVVTFFSGLMAMSGLGTALLFVPFFYYLGVPLTEAVPTALLLNAVSLSFASVNYVRGQLVDWRMGLPILIAAVALAPLGAMATPYVNKALLLALFAGFLVFAGTMMLFYRGKPRPIASRSVAGAGMAFGVGGVAGFLGGLLGVGGSNVIVPALNWFGLDPKIAAGTTALVVTFSSISGFLGHVAMSTLEPTFIGAMALMAAVGAIVGSQLMRTRISSVQLKHVLGVALWIIAAKIIFDLTK
jgi:uncharacterized protein